MKKYLLRIFIIFLILFGVLGITSCDTNPNSNAGNTKNTDNGNNAITDDTDNNTTNNDNGNNTTNEQKDNLNYVEYVFYTDSEPIENDKIKIEWDKPSCYSSGSNYSLTTIIKITNKEYVTNEYNFKSIKLTKESTGAQYTAGGYLGLSKLSIEPELNKSFVIGYTIPSSINTDKYKLSLEINNYKITYYLYDTPDELREDRTINYYIDNNIVNTIIIKDGKTFTNNYVYESPDNLYYCNNWWLDSNLSTRLSSTIVINENTNFYGLKFSNLKWMTTSTDAYSFVNGVNYIPSNGVLVIPSSYLNKEVCIGVYAIKNIDVKEIYIPKTVHQIYTGNFTGIGNATIYYEGTEEEWKTLFVSAFDVIPTNVVYNTKYSG